MVVALAIGFTFSAFVLLIGRLLTGSPESDAHRMERILSGEAIAGWYRPMERLLREDDWRYLAARPDVSPARIRQMRARRRDLFCAYLRSLTGDFSAICLVVRALIVQSSADRPDLARALSAARRSFYYTLFRVRLCLIAHYFGVSGVRIDVSGLTRTLEALAAQARTLQLGPEPQFA